MSVKKFLVGSLMTRTPVTIKPSDTVLEAAKTMDKLSIGALPVVDEEGKLVGIITERDLVRRIIAKEKPYDTKVEEVMTPKPLTVTPENTIEEAIRIMSKLKARHLPVVDEEGKLVGIISIKDIEFSTI